MLRRNPSRPNPGVDADGPVTKYPPYKCWIGIPIGSMYGIYANIWGILMVNVTIYSIHGSHGIGIIIFEIPYQHSSYQRYFHWEGRFTTWHVLPHGTGRWVLVWAFMKPLATIWVKCLAPPKPAHVVSFWLSKPSIVNANDFHSVTCIWLHALYMIPNIANATPKFEAFLPILSIFLTAHFHQFPTLGSWSGDHRVAAAAQLSVRYVALAVPPRLGTWSLGPASWRGCFASDFMGLLKVIWNDKIPQGISYTIWESWGIYNIYSMCCFFGRGPQANPSWISLVKRCDCLVLWFSAPKMGWLWLRNMTLMFFRGVKTPSAKLGWSPTW